ncbi:MAG: DUF3232 domain-containing protein [Ruminococcaceae bacterium]|nr:DUF3232 domain-containing protein [Oscillospiraceae bacterium]
MINESSIISLIESIGTDADLISLLDDCIASFEKYHEAVYKLEMYKKIHGRNVKNGEIYRDTVMELDRNRTVCHNSLIANMSIINRLAEMNSIPPVYDGIVSEERPHRRILANEVFEYVEKVIKNRE